MNTVADSDWNARRNAFLNSVLEQLLEARFEIEVLKKRVEKERAEYRCQRVDPTIGLPDLPGTQPMPHEWQTDLAVRLQTAEMGFDKAKEEYNKMKESLTAANTEVAFIKSRNQQLEYDLFEVRTQRDQLLEEQGHLSAVLRNDYAAQAFPDNGTNGQWSLARGTIPKLLATIEARDAEIKNLQETVNREHTTNEQLKQRLATVSEMQNTSKTVFETISTRLHATASTRTRSASESNPNRNPGTEKETTLPVDRQPSTLRSTRSVITRKSSLATSNNTSYITNIPEERLRTLRDFDTVIAPASSTATSTNAPYTRDFLKTNVGGSIQPLIVRVTHSQTALAEKHGINCYLCPNLEHNPWCPTIPGQHGYIFVGLGVDKDAFAGKEEFYTVFVGIKEGSSRRFRYLGRYTATHVAPLTVAEWNTLAPSVQMTYSETTKKKTKDTRPVEKIKSLYDEGALSVPCVLLECVGIDHELSSSLESALHNGPALKTGSVSPSKRRREIQDEGETVSHTRTRRTTTSLNGVAASNASRL
ncbi:uncharacterized protein EV420DRAFT_944885 [Desarmillaria tabescens]|uniref:DUF6697 domain-containing protein n=1 Tax=Armillaria tabescens TaxID=1929756 RepID=A0AA39NGG2_ARMTA|nr:uncharacterized protein EV420DRAFT_944885 [Desarmillaria tabescens]KAK0465186.1 hypothetical protein EV420DRAFT_944885 [Desarmillaria tabescens]